jgi:lipoprotein-anchoring transpeptidase ErfK/SrfK
MNIFFYILVFSVFSQNIYATNYSISVCTTSTEESANRCKNDILKTIKEDVFILHNENDKKYRTYLGSFSTYKEAKDFLLKSSTYIKKQKPFIKILETSAQINTNINTIPKPNEYASALENFYTKKTKLINLDKISDYDNLIIEVNSNNNIMLLKGLSEQKFINIKSYKVSTAKTNIKKPLGVGNITAISLEPSWYPTQKTLRAFRQKGINLPSTVPFGHKLNYMGSAKINLSHRVNGNEVYRIHGTLNEDTIGTNESSGCIRMKNNEVVELASLLNNFASLKSFDKIKVILK